MTYFISLLKSLGAYIIPYVSEGLIRFIKNQIELKNKIEEKNKKEELLKDAIEKEKNAKTEKEQEDAFKDIIDHANGD